MAMRARLLAVSPERALPSTPLRFDGLTVRRTWLPHPWPFAHEGSDIEEGTTVEKEFNC